MKPYLVLFLCLLGSAGFAQKDSASIVSQLSLSAADTLDFTKRTAAQMGEVFRITDRYPSGQVAVIGFSKIVPKQTDYQKEGVYTTFYPDGSVKSKSFFKDNKPVGNRFLYYPGKRLYMSERIDTLNGIAYYNLAELKYPDGEPMLSNGSGHAWLITENGKVIEHGLFRDFKRDSVWLGTDLIDAVRFTEVYKYGVLASGVSRDNVGNTYTYSTIYEEASFPGGKSALYIFLGENVNYPKEAQRNNITGKVFHSFTILPDGKITDLRLLKSPHPSLHEEAYRVITKMSGMWLPAKLRGRPFSQKFTLPISFDIR